MIIYLSDVVEGGETVFPNSTMQPVRDNSCLPLHGLDALWQHDTHALCLNNGHNGGF